MTIGHATFNVAMVIALPYLNRANLTLTETAWTNPCAILAAVSKATGISWIRLLSILTGKGMANIERVYP